MSALVKAGSNQTQESNSLTIIVVPVKDSSRSTQIPNIRASLDSPRDAPPSNHITSPDFGKFNIINGRPFN